MVKELNFDKLLPGAKVKPLMEQVFYLFSTETVIKNEDLQELNKWLDKWTLPVPSIGGFVSFTESEVYTNKTFFALTVEYPTLNNVTADDLTSAAGQIEEHFKRFFSSRVNAVGIEYD